MNPFRRRPFWGWYRVLAWLGWRPLFMVEVPGEHQNWTTNRAYFWPGDAKQYQDEFIAEGDTTARVATYWAWSWKWMGR